MPSCWRCLIGLAALLPIALGSAQANLLKGAAPPELPTVPAVSRSASAAANPEGRVGRLRSSSGAVLFHAAGESNWQPAGVNYPAAAGEGFKTDAQGEAEIEIGAERIRLDGNTRLEIIALDRARVALSLAEGRIGIRLAQSAPGERTEIAVAGGTALLLDPGDYELDASRIAVFRGRARFLGGGADITLGAAKSLGFAGGKPVAEGIAPAEGGLAHWLTEPAPADSDSSPEFAAGMTGSEDLAANGRWQTIPVLGAVWVPQNVPPDWAPYRLGRWIWIPPWGWTWIARESWGFAPFHYGRWTRLGAHWAWVPGTRISNPVYAPALVAFLGTAGIGLSYAGGRGPAIGWFPLGPREVYWPSYSRDLGYIRDLNRGAVADPQTIRMNPNGLPPVEVVKTRFDNRRAATVVPRPAFAGGRPVETALLTLPQERLEEAPAIMGSPRVTPAMLRQLAAPPPAPPRLAHNVKARPTRAHLKAHPVARTGKRTTREAAVHRPSVQRAKPKTTARVQARHAAGSHLRTAKRAARVRLVRAPPRPHRASRLTASRRLAENAR